MAQIQVIDNSQEVLEALSEQAVKALEACGLVAEGYAKLNAPVDTGALRNSISYKVIENECFIGTNMEYAPYIEFGTGVHSTLGGRQTPWVYQDAKGNFWMTDGQRTKPFLKPAVADHTGEYQQIIEDNMKS